MKNEEEEIKDSVEKEPELDNWEEKSEKTEEENCINQMIRLQADFDNYRKRTLREKDDIFKYALEDFSVKLLPVVDNLERAVKSLDEGGVNDDYANGVRMVLVQLNDALKKEGLEEIDCTNAEFDPNYHYGVAVEESEEYDDNKVIEVFQKGYKFKEKVIRPAMVKISRK